MRHNSLNISGRKIHLFVNHGLHSKNNHYGEKLNLRNLFTKKTLFFFFFFIYTFSAVFAVTDNEKTLSYEVSWDKGITTAVSVFSVKNNEGIPRTFGDETVSINSLKMSAYSESESKAREAIIAGINDLQITSDKKLADFLEESIPAQHEIDRVTREKINTVNVPTDFFSAKCTATLSITDILSVLPIAYPENDFPVMAKPAMKTDYTGIIIDLRGQPYKPIVLPSIYDDEGLEIYGSDFVDRNIALKKGIVLYCFDEKTAFSARKSGEKPFYTSAIRLLNGSPVISFSDTRKLLSSNVTRKNLKKCKVVFLIDRETNPPIINSANDRKKTDMKNNKASIETKKGDEK